MVTEKIMNKDFLKELGLNDQNSGTVTGKNSSNSGEFIKSYSPVDGEYIGSVSVTTRKEYDALIETSQNAFQTWIKIPAPQRGEIVRQYGDKLRKYKAALGKLVSYEMGKSYQEGLGEVQEMIDICDFAVGQSRQLYGLTMHSERPEHRMYEQYHPLGIVGIISAFNFPVAVWAWNSMLALIAGDTAVWKASEKSPLCSVACMNIWSEVMDDNPQIPEGLMCIVNGDYKVGEFMTTDKRVPLISATGSTRMGRIVGQTVAGRFGRSLLELGGNNAIIVTPSANMDIVLTSVVFGAVGTCGQRCTSTRRVFVHEDIYDQFVSSVQSAYKQIKIGNPLDESNHMGPLIDQMAVDNFLNSINEVKKAGGSFIVEGGVHKVDGFENGHYVTPCVAAVENSWDIVQTETFAPILYIMKYSDLDEAIAMQNDVPQGLSSAIMTNNMQEAEKFLCCAGSDCGIANVNIGTSGAEIGGAFGGEKETGGGRESGSDSWKAYMRRQTNTINYGKTVPLAQGIKFDF